MVRRNVHVRLVFFNAFLYQIEKFAKSDASLWRDATAFQIFIEFIQC